MTPPCFSFPLISRNFCSSAQVVDTTLKYTLDYRSNYNYRIYTLYEEPLRTDDNQPLSGKENIMGETRKTTDLWITTNNELGVLAKMTTQFKGSNINIEYFVGWEEGNKANFRIITNDNTKARDFLTKEGYTVQETPCTLWQSPNTPGMLNAATTALAEARINTYAAYHTTSPGTNTATVAFYTDNPDRTTEILGKLG